jgi:hypothetical protein
MRRSTRAMVLVGVAAIVALFAVASPASANPGPNGTSTKGGVGPAATTLLSYGGGPIQTAPVVYIVYWGSQWGTSSITNDPSGEAPLQLSFFNNMFGSGDTWSTSTTQYCQGVPVGTTQCGTSGTHVGHPSSSPVRGTWLDSGVSSPRRPTQSQIRSEAVRAAQHFGVTGANVQIIVDAAHGIKPSGFGTQYCAYHDATTLNGQILPFTNMPYVTDVGASCGANFVATGGSGVNGATEGVTIVGGHEYAETATDPGAGDGWLGGGAENGDLCAWISSGQGAAAIVSLNGTNYAVQSLWSNNFNSNSGGCVIFYQSATNQH